MTLLPLSTPYDLDAYQSGDVDALLSASDAAIRAYCGWHIAPEVTETVTVFGGFVADKLFVPSLHLTAVSSIVIDDVAVDLTTVEVSEAGYIQTLAGYWPTSVWSWSTGPRAATVTMTHGYDTIPADVLAVVGSIASRAAQSPDGVVRQQVGLVSTTYSQSAFNVAGGVALLQFERDILDLYKIRVLA